MTTTQIQEPKIEIFYRPIDVTSEASHTFLVYTDADGDKLRNYGDSYRINKFLLV